MAGGGDVFPQTNQDNIDAAKLIFTRIRPANLRILSVGLTRTCNKWDWLVVYTAKAPTNIIDIKRQLQRCCPVGCKLMKVAEMYFSTYHYYVTYSNIRHTVKLSDFIPSCVFNKTNTPKIHPDLDMSSKKTIKDKGALKPIDCEVEVKRNSNIVIVPMSEVTSEDLPRKMVYKGRNVTSKFVTKTRLSGFHYNYIKDRAEQTALRIRTSLKSIIKFSPQLKLKPKLTENLPIQEEKAPKIDFVRAEGSRVPYDYSALERSYKLRKLSDARVYRAVRHYCSMMNFHRPGHGQVKRVGRTDLFDLRNQVFSEGLPLDKTLYDIFLEQAERQGLSKVEVDADLTMIQTGKYELV